MTALLYIRFIMKKISVLLLLMIGMLACEQINKPVFSENYLFKNKLWNRFNKLSFDIPVKASSKTYDLYFEVTVDEHFAHKNIPLHAIIDLPGGTQRIYEFNIHIKDRGEKMLVEMDDEGYYRIEQELWTNLSFSEDGIAKLTLEQIIPKLNTHGVKSAGVLLRKAK